MASGGPDLRADAGAPVLDPDSPTPGPLRTAWERFRHRMTATWGRTRRRLENDWQRFRRFWAVFRDSRLGVIGLILLLVFVFMAVSAPIFTSVGWLRAPDTMLCGTDYHACFAEDPSPTTRFAPPSWSALLGTDKFGRDIFSRLWWGAQITILIGLFASVISMGLGTFVGMVAGYYGGTTDELLMRITDFFLVLPTLVLAIILAGMFREAGGGSSFSLIIVIGITLWASTARLVRSQVLSLKERQFVERAKAVGAGQTRIVWYHIFPNAFSLVFAEAILTIAVAILTESFMSYIGLGPADATTWGKMIEEGIMYSAIQLAPVWILAPGIAIVIVVLGFTLLGYALDEIFNPRLRRR